MAKRLRVLKEYCTVACIGALGYGLIEVLWRGFTHWTMVFTGGFCFLALYRMQNERVHWLPRCLKGSVVITAIEFMVGVIVNLKLKWNVWDYSKLFGNIYGQICPLYSVFWFFLSIPLYRLADLLKKRLKVK